MDFRLGERSEEFRTEVRAFLDEVFDAEMEERIHRTGVSFDAEFTAALVERGWWAPGWPVGLGGDGSDPMESLPLAEELLRKGAPTDTGLTTRMVAKVVAMAGSDELKQLIVPPVLRGEMILALGFSEPESGSDVAAAQTRAVRDGDEWVINGQKMFTTNAHVADYVFLLTRTNTEVPKHKGLTTFLVPLDSEGIEVQPVYTLSGERTNITFYDDVRVPDAQRIGDVDAGWNVMMLSLQEEHSGGWASACTGVVEHTEAWAREAVDDDGQPRIDDPEVRRRLARAATRAEVALLLQRRAAWMTEIGDVPEAEGPMAKLFTSEALLELAQDLNELMAPDSLRSYFEPTAPQLGRVEHALRHAVGTTIVGGASEVQRNIIASRGLGLPR